MSVLKLILRVATGLILSLNIAAASSSFSNLLFFGDSLTDMGNHESAPYSDQPGTLWPHILAKHYGLPLSKSGLSGEMGGNNWAVAGATSVSVAEQVRTFLALQPTISPNDIAFIWIGANDLLDKVLKVWPDPQPIDEVVDDAMKNISTAISLLKTAGVKNIVVINLFSLEITPAAKFAQMEFGDIIIDVIRDSSTKFNTALAKTAANVSYFDADAELKVVLDNHDAYGLKNLTQPLKQCLMLCRPDKPCACEPTEFLFWDAVHPTNAAHKIMGEFMIRFIDQGVITTASRS